jgi:hypothetical protein
VAGNCDCAWKFVYARRLFMLVNISIYEDMCWVVFEPNESGTDYRERDKKRGRQLSFLRGARAGYWFWSEVRVSALQ